MLVNLLVHVAVAAAAWTNGTAQRRTAETTHKLDLCHIVSERPSKPLRVEEQHTARNDAFNTFYNELNG